MNARSRFRPQSSIPNGHTACAPPAWKDRSTGKKKRKKMGGGGGGVLLAHSAQLAVQYSIGPCLKVWYCYRPALFDCRLHSEIMDQYIYIYMTVYRTSPCLEWCPTAGASLFWIISPVISRNRLLALEICNPSTTAKTWVADSNSWATTVITTVNFEC